MSTGILISGKNEDHFRETINEEVLCVLRKNKLTNEIQIDYIKIENPFGSTIVSLSILCDDPNCILPQLISFLKSRPELNRLPSSVYRYCHNLEDSFQRFAVDNEDTIRQIVMIQEQIQVEYKDYPNKDLIKNEVARFKKQVKNAYVLWSKAFSNKKSL